MTTPSRIFARAFLALFDLHLRRRFYWLVDVYTARIGRRPCLAAPRAQTEKIQWRKLFDRNPLFARLQDKLEIKRMVRELAPGQEVPEVWWEGDDPADIPFDDFVRPYIVKVNHGCDMNVFVPDPGSVDRAQTIATVRGYLKQVFGAPPLYEVIYADIVPRAFVEELLIDHRGLRPREYRLWVTGGEVRYVNASDRDVAPKKMAAYDLAWRKLPACNVGKTNDIDFPRPLGLDRMVETARIVGGLVDAARVDFYESEGRSWLGECTIFTSSGYTGRLPDSYDFEWGRDWDIRRSHFFSGRPNWKRRLYRWCLDQVYDSQSSTEGPPRATQERRPDPTKLAAE